ncbi:hypothetical protein [Planktotalea sp.]|uniref:hypothetical protein n=1 Tax=Planktotalea sp. TaxID=2029877 RepID=UPI003D6B07E9
MTASSHADPIGINQPALATDTPTRFLDGFPSKALTFAKRFKASAAKFVHNLQVARMLSTLSTMSDQELTHIGITREGIPEYAKRLMAKGE